jgi:RNA polymerase sigma-70 factor (ECF subfamily)
MEDRELVSRVLEGDPAAQELLVELNRSNLHRVCIHILGYGDPEVEDVLQETFASAFQKLGGFEFRSSLAHWLRQICVHYCYRRWRKRKRMVMLEQDQLEVLLAPEALSREGDAGHEEERAIKTNALEKGKEGLGEPCRELIGLRDETGKSYAEIAEFLRVPMGTVMSRLARCREILRQLVQRYLSGELNA